MQNIDSYLTRLRTALENVDSIVNATTHDMLDDSSGVLEELSSKISSVSSRLESSITTLEGQNTILNNNADSDWGLTLDDVYDD